jgi:hypothetical protein
MDKFLYLVFSHTNPDQVRRLANTICRHSPRGRVVIHHDGSQPALSSSGFADAARVSVVPRPLPVRWGDFSFVQAFLHSTEWILRDIDFDWLVTISGMDYPIQPLSRFETLLASSGADGFFRYFAVLEPGHWPENTGRRRYYYNYYTWPKFVFLLLQTSLLGQAGAATPAREVQLRAVNCENSAGIP